MKQKIRIAAGPIAWYMKLCGFIGWASFWRVIYIMPGHEHEQRLIRHELCHLEQIERDGRIWFSIRYIYWLARYGYWMNPYEVEARRVSEGVHYA